MNERPQKDKEKNEAPALWTLQNTDCQVTLCPDVGGTIARFSWRGHEILRPAPDTAIHERLVRQMGCYPLIPFSNRVGHAELIVGEQHYRLRANDQPELHALHGFGWQRAWHVTSHTGDAVELSLTHTPDVDWPFACDALQGMRLIDNTLTLRLRVRNTDKRPMPAGIGFHPYFPINRDTTLQTRWKGMWQMGADSLPAELVAVPPEADFSQSRPIDLWKVDNCFTGWNRRAVLDYPTHRVQLDASSGCRQIVCFSPGDGRRFIALEPVTNINNAFALAAKGVADTGMQMLAAGKTLAVSLSIAVSARQGANSS